MDYEQMSAIEIVCELLKQRHEPTPIVEIIQEALKLKGIDDFDGEQTARLYMDVTTSSLFVFCGEGKWDLKANQSLEVYDRDGSFFGTNITFDEDEDDGVDVSDYNIDEEDEDDDMDSEKDEEDVKLYEEDEKDEDESEYESEDDSDEEDDEDEDYDDYLDEDKYNDIMDNYEDLYDK